MKLTGKLALACAGSAILASCAGTHQAYFRPDTTAQAMQQDLAQCEVEASKLYPSARVPVGYVGYGGYGGPWGGPWSGYPGYPGWGWSGGYGSVQTVDENRSAREDYRADCMVARGYSSQPVPYCTSEQTEGQRFEALPQNRAPDGPVCAARNGRDVYLVNPQAPLATPASAG